LSFSPDISNLYEKSNFIVLMWWLTVEGIRRIVPRPGKRASQTKAQHHRESTQFTVMEQSFHPKLATDVLAANI
jgi:hypothetical protein